MLSLFLCENVRGVWYKMAVCVWGGTRAPAVCEQNYVSNVYVCVGLYGYTEESCSSYITSHVHQVCHNHITNGLSTFKKDEETVLHLKSMAHGN